MDQRHVAALSLLCRDVARSAILAFVIENDVMIFNWFTPAPPVEVREKAWIEVRLRWLADQFGIDRLTKAELVLPSADWLSDAEDESPESARRILDRVCHCMRIDPSPLRLVVHEDQEMHVAASIDEPATIHVAQSQLGDAEVLVATLARQLAWELLVGQKRLAGNEPDRAWVAELLPVFLGLGVFLSNATLRENRHHGGRSVAKHCYLTARMLAALNIALLRNKPEMDYLLHAVRAIALDPEAAIEELVQACDVELRQQAPGMLAECRPIEESDGGPGSWFGRHNR
jgi:hypothetical protein